MGSRTKKLLITKISYINNINNEAVQLENFEIKSVLLNYRMLW